MVSPKGAALSVQMPAEAPQLEQVADTHWAAFGGGGLWRLAALYWRFAAALEAPDSTSTPSKRRVQKMGVR